MKKFKISKSWILFLLIIFLISIQYNSGSGFWFEGLNAINNLSYNPEENDLTYYNDYKEKAYSYDLDTYSWDDAAWIDRSKENFNDDFIYSFEHILVDTVNITIIKNGQAFSNNYTVYFEEVNSQENTSIQVLDFEKLYFYNNILYILHQDTPERSIRRDDIILYHIMRIRIDNFGNGSFALTNYSLDFFDPIIPGDFSRGNQGESLLYQTMEGKLIYFTIPAIYSFYCSNTSAEDVIKYELPKGENYAPNITFHKTSSSMLIRYRIDQFNVTLQYFRFYEDRIVKEKQWEYSVFVHNALGPQVFINETTVIISDYRDIMMSGRTGKPATPGSRILTNMDGELRGTTWLYFMNLETSLAVPIEIPDYITRDGFQLFVYFIEYLDWLLPMITGGLIVIYIIERIIKLTRFIIRKRRKNNDA